MQTLLIIAGVLLIAAAMLDAFWTTLSFAGGGPLTRRVARVIWATALGIHRLRPRRAHGLLRATGTVILLTTVGVWILAVLAGYVLMFSSDPMAVVDGRTGAPVNLVARIYFTGFTLFTLGIGDLVPGSDAWRIVTVIATLNGLFLVTLAITYLIPVVSAAVHKHQLGAVVFDLGDDAQDIVIRAWDGKGFDGLSNYLVQLAPMIDLHVQRHLAYPVLHYFYAADRRWAVAPGLAALHDALLILSSAVAPGHRPAAIVVEPTQRALDGLLSLLHTGYIARGADAPPAPRLSALRMAGIPMVSDAQFETDARDAEDRRALLAAYVENSGWTWEAAATPHG